ncbi:MAG: hypothetical protein CSA07_02575 [Bacteroidia bacterium]|nr:MAG: hypothetical protein CSA07_02575 [Bacteroidia bacterium]
MKVENGKKVSVSYVLTVDGEVRDQATSQQPLEFIFGVGQLIPGFEQGVEGKQLGDTFTIDIEPEDAYGEYVEEKRVTLQMDIFRQEDGEVDREVVKVGNHLPMVTQDGQQLVGRILDMNDTHVVMDFNHELAGFKLHFEGRVEKLAEATEDELAALLNQGGCGGCGGGCGEGCGDHGHHHHGEACCGGGHHHGDGEGCCGDGQHGQHHSDEEACCGGGHHHHADGQSHCDGKGHGHHHGEGGSCCGGGPHHGEGEGKCDGTGKEHGGKGKHCVQK